MNDIEEEKALLEELEKRNIKAFKRFYKAYSEDLLILAFSLSGNSKRAIRIVDELFERLWMEAKFTEITPPIYKFLYMETLKSYKDDLS